MLRADGVVPAVTGPLTAMAGVATAAAAAWLVTVRTTVTSCPTVARSGATSVLAVRKAPRLTSTALVLALGASTGRLVSAAVPDAPMTKTPPPGAVAV